MDVRFANKPGITAHVKYVGIGDVFVLAGQSNMRPVATNVQSYSHATLRAGLYQNIGVWCELDDLYSIDSYAKSCWPLLTTEFLAAEGVPVAFVSVAVGGTAIIQWTPGHADGYYDAMIAAITAVGGVKAVLWHQGETDARLLTSEADYNTRLDTIADAVNASEGVALMAAKLQDVAAYNETNVNAAIGTAWGDNANVLQGADFTGFAPDGDIHFTSDADMQKQAGVGAEAGWWDAIKAEWY